MPWAATRPSNLDSADSILISLIFYEVILSIAKRSEAKFGEAKNRVVYNAILHFVFLRFASKDSVQDDLLDIVLLKGKLPDLPGMPIAETIKINSLG